MRQIIYIDLLLILNLFINYLLLLAAKKLSGSKSGRVRIFFAALAGAVFSLSIFLPRLNFLLIVLIKIVFFALIIFIAFGFRSKTAFLRVSLWFLGLNLLLAGFIFAVYFFFAPKGLIYSNGVVYIDISPIVLILLTVVCYLIIIAFDRLFKKTSRISRLYKLHVRVGDKQAELYAITDTGNSLSDLISSNPCIIAEYNAVKEVIPPSIQKYFSSHSALPSDYESMPDNWGTRYRLIPFSTIAGSGILPAFRSDNLTIMLEKGVKHIADCIVAVVKDRLSDGQYNSIFNPDILNK